MLFPFHWRFVLTLENFTRKILTKPCFFNRSLTMKVLQQLMQDQQKEDTLLKTNQQFYQVNQANLQKMVVISLKKKENEENKEDDNDKIKYVLSVDELLPVKAVNIL